MNELRDAVRSLLARRPDDPWPRLAGEIGAAGLAIPERFGGAGATLAETQVVLAELGRTLSPAPLLGSAVLAGQALLLGGDEDACARLLPAIAAGTRTAALAWASAAGWQEPAITLDDDGTLTGAAHYVLDGASADLVLAVTSEGLYEVDTAGTPESTMDETRALARITLEHTPGRRVGDVDLDALRDLGCVALSAEQVGTAERALELTVDHTKTRVQFGRPIGSFQALQHRMADLHVLVETARAASGAAADAVGTPALPLAAAVAKVHCSEALMRVAGEMIQLHGGIGITWEHPAHRYFKRAHGAWHLFGQPSEHVARIAPLTLTG